MASHFSSESDLSLHETLTVAVEAARDAGQVLKDGQQTARASATQKTALVDVVTEVDRAAERVVVDAITSAFPDDGIVGEEGASRPSSTGRRWIIDPLDGTANFIRNWRVSAVSIGVEVDSEFTIGVVFNPLVEEMFTAITGGGAWLNGEALHLATADVPLAGAYVGMDGGFTPWARNQRAHIAGRLLRETGEPRYLGSTALSLCHVAMGRTDAHINIGSSIWDIAAGTVIAREAGALVEGLQAGSQPTPEHTIAARPELLAAFHSMVNEAVNLFPTDN